jgi:hypothetical protein
VITQSFFVGSLTITVPAGVAKFFALNPETETDRRSVCSPLLVTFFADRLKATADKVRELTGFEAVETGLVPIEFVATTVKV